MKSLHEQSMELAIEMMSQSKPDSTGGVPRVGAVAVLGNEVIGRAYRDERDPGKGEHAEYLLLEHHLKDRKLVGASVYTTLEPCTKRGEGKTPCVERLIDRKVGRVIIGMLDPNPIVRGLGFRKLRDANIRTDVFPHGLMARVEELNRDFINAIEKNPIHQITQEIAALSVAVKRPVQTRSISTALDRCAETLRRIVKGQIPIADNEAGYFNRWLDLVETFHGNEDVKAYIRLPAFDPNDLLKRNWFNEFYMQLRAHVASGRVRIRYVFLLATNQPDSASQAFLDSFKDFVHEIKIVTLRGRHAAPEMLRPSIVLFQKQRVAFTHDRGDNGVLTEADEWIFERDYERLRRQFREIELASEIYWP
ncbi:MAG: hypothetical protein JO340_06380 [Acidobacteriaceae bacterium]|nr:hypothetical protein [Acidobacteriaceae bacterium]